MQTNSMYYVDEDMVRIVNFTAQSTFEEYAYYWLGKNKLRLAPKTYSRYVDLMRRVKLGIGHIKLGNIKSVHIEEFCRRLSLPGANFRTGKELSPKTILHHYRLISVVLQSAVRDGIIDCNPCDKQHCASPKVEQNEISCLQLSEVKKICNNIDRLSCPIALVILLGLFTGMRRGEIAGLKWEDIDSDNMAINVKRSIAYTVQSGTIVKSPKTPTSYRVVFFYELMLKCKIREYMRWYRETYGRLELIDYVFPNSHNVSAPIHPDTLSNWAEKASSIIGVNIKMHKLRHTYVSLQIANNTPLKEIAYNVGHSKLTTTCDTYAHLIRLHNKPSVSSLEKLIG